MSYWVTQKLICTVILRICIGKVRDLQYIFAVTSGSPSTIHFMYHDFALVSVKFLVGRLGNHDGRSEIKLSLTFNSTPSSGEYSNYCMTQMEETPCSIQYSQARIRNFRKSGRGGIRPPPSLNVLYFPSL